MKLPPDVEDSDDEGPREIERANFGNTLTKFAARSGTTEHQGGDAKESKKDEPRRQSRRHPPTPNPTPTAAELQEQASPDGVDGQTAEESGTIELNDRTDQSVRDAHAPTPDVEEA